MSTDGIRRGRQAPFAMIPEWVIVAPISRPARLLYVVLAAHVNHARGDGLVWPGLEACAELMQFKNRQNLTRYIAELEDLGAIDVEVETTRTGRRNTYVVHEMPPAGYAGQYDLLAFHKARAERPDAESTTSRVAKRDVTGGKGVTSRKTPQTSKNAVDAERPDAESQGGRNSQVAMGGNQGVATDGNSGVARTKGTRTTGSGTKRNGASASGAAAGARAAAHAATPRAPINGKHLEGLDAKTLARKLTSIWSAVVTEYGGTLPAQDYGGWDHDGTRLERGQHPMGKNVKAWLEANPNPNAELLDAALAQIRSDAQQWAERTAA